LTVSDVYPRGRQIALAIVIVSFGAVSKFLFVLITIVFSRSFLAGEFGLARAQQFYLQRVKRLESKNDFEKMRQIEIKIKRKKEKRTNLCSRLLQETQ
jgi:hypothetical protein